LLRSKHAEQADGAADQTTDEMRRLDEQHAQVFYFFKIKIKRKKEKFLPTFPFIMAAHFLFSLYLNFFLFLQALQRLVTRKRKANAMRIDALGQDRDLRVYYVVEDEPRLFVEQPKVRAWSK
jgi:hypothetical protein